jgi:Icc-related predicted phosphoesterase
MRLFRGRERGGERTRILFVTDLHGADVCFRKFLNAVGVYEADIAVLGGDLTGKSIVPVVETSRGYAATVRGKNELATNDEELERIVKLIRDTGQYPVTMTEQDEAELEREAIDELFVGACHDQVRDWMERAAERLEPEGIPVYVTGGNDDYFSIEEILDDAPYVENAEGQVLEIPPGIQMISSGYGNITPWRCPRDIPEEELAGKIEEMASQLSDPGAAIFNLHVPPLGSGLDVCPKLDTSVYPPRPMAGEVVAAGSVAVRDAIERFGPMLSLHGHIHEASGITELGSTTAVNPGSEYAQGVLRSAVIDIRDGKVDSAQLLAA